jgi:hypothetical protein
MADLKETQHPSFRLPTKKDIRIWRYTDLAKYLSMLDRQCLYFARSTNLGDPFEGSSTKAMVAQREYIKANRKTDPQLSAYKELPDGAVDWGVLPRFNIDKYLINCWHVNEHESAAMWKLYFSSNEAVCIQSTYSRLRLCLPNCVLIGEVNYIDYETQGVNVDNAFNFIIHKRKSFEHERELRAIFWESDGSAEAQPYKAQIEPTGLAIKVSLPTLVENIYVSPTAPHWFGRLVAAVTAKYGFTFSVKQSNLAATPLF